MNLPNRCCLPFTDVLSLLNTVIPLVNRKLHGGPPCLTHTHSHSDFTLADVCFWRKLRKDPSTSLLLLLLAKHRYLLIKRIKRIYLYLCYFIFSHKAAHVFCLFSLGRRYKVISKYCYISEVSLCIIPLRETCEYYLPTYCHVPPFYQ